MAEEIHSLADLGELTKNAAAAAEATTDDSELLPEPQRDAQGRANEDSARPAYSIL